MNTPAQHPEVSRLLRLCERVGNDPLLTQGSTGNASIKLGERLWIKASGKWLANASCDDFLVALNLHDVRQCVENTVDPTEHFAHASIETSMHAVIPHRVVLHVHCINTIAWAVRTDAPRELDRRLQGLPWTWIPYVSSGLMLAQSIMSAQNAAPGAEVLVLGNHGLVLGGPDCASVEKLLTEVAQRLTITPRTAPEADHTVLEELTALLSWEMPDDEDVHALGTDPVSRDILSGGLLYPCQAIFSNTSKAAASFRPVLWGRTETLVPELPRNRSFLIVEGCGVVLDPTAPRTTRLMLSGLAQVAQRIAKGTPIRYLAEKEVPGFSDPLARRYRDLSDAGHTAAGSPSPLQATLGQ